MKRMNRIRNRSCATVEHVAISLSLALALGFVSTVVNCHGQGTLTIRFEGPPPLLPGHGNRTETYAEAGMDFRPLGDLLPGSGVIRLRGGYYSWPDNGTAYLSGAPVPTNTLAFGFSDGLIFDLISVDLAEDIGVPPVAAIVQFVGYRHSGGIVSMAFTTDGFNAGGASSLADFQTFYFGPEFRGLDRVEIPSHGWSLDNLVVSIPEPSAGALLVAGGFLLWSLYRWTKRGTP